MKNRTFFFPLYVLVLPLGTVPLSGCSYWKAHQARAAYAEYQQAIGTGDMMHARIALLKLVRTDEDVADYWIQLGKLQIQLNDYSGAYDAFSHAHELDRSNVEVLAALAQIALMSRDVDLAYGKAKNLALLDPDNPVVTLINGYVSLKSGDLDKADAAADTLLASTPNDSFARALKASILVKRGKTDAAIASLEEQHQQAPKDVGTIRALSQLYRSQDDWRNLARIQSDAFQNDPKNPQTAKDYIEALLRGGDVQAAARVSGPLLTPSSDVRFTDEILSLWARFAPKGTKLPNGPGLAKTATVDQRVFFADYYNRIGDPGTAAALLGASKTVNHVNARWNAVFAQSLALQGQARQAKALLDQVLAGEPDQVEALRARSRLEAQTGQAKQAIVDAQRLVTINPKSGEDRLLLAQGYLAARNGRDVRRTLWQAFQELPDDERVYAALRSVLATTGDSEGAQRLKQELADRRYAALTKELL